MRNGINRGAKIVSEKIRGIDRYSRIITFTYKNKDTFGTVFGGLVSIATYLVLAIYASAILKIMLERKGTSRSLIHLLILEIIKIVNNIEFYIQRLL